MRSRDEIKADIVTWSEGTSRNKYILKKLEAELAKAKEPMSVPDPGPESKPGVKEIKPTEKELFKMTKKEQVDMLESFGVKEIPRFEKGRVQMILDMQ